MLSGNHYAQVEGNSYVLLVTTPTFKCESLSSFAKFGFVYKMSNHVQVVFQHVLMPDKVAGEIRELTNLWNLRNKTQEMRKHIWENTDSALSQCYRPLRERGESVFSQTWQNCNNRSFLSVKVLNTRKLTNVWLSIFDLDIYIYI